MNNNLKKIEKEIIALKDKVAFLKQEYLFFWKEFQKAETLLWRRLEKKKKLKLVKKSK